MRVDAGRAAGRGQAGQRGQTEEWRSLIYWEALGVNTELVNLTDPRTQTETSARLETSGWPGRGRGLKSSSRQIKTKH